MGERIKTDVRDAGGVVWRDRCWIQGTRNARVFPVPVFARARLDGGYYSDEPSVGWAYMSSPDRTGPRVSAWTSEQVSNGMACKRT